MGEQNRERKPRMAVWLVVALIGCAAIGWLVADGIRARLRASVALAKETEQAAAINVNVVSPRLDGAGGELVLPGNAQAYQDTPVYARTSGYLKSWHFDIGAHVKKGQLLAVIEAPELDKQLLQARANLATAEAKLGIATITANRSERLLKTDSISTQERDNAVATAAADRAIVEANRAEVARLEQLQSYEQVTAPFDGVITARNTDVGALITAGSGGSKELFHVGSTGKLRVYVDVPQAWSRVVRAGTTARLTLAEYPERDFPCVQVRNSASIDPAKRTLLVEFEVNNASGAILPGAYVQVRVKLPAGAATMTIPSNTLLFRPDGVRVGVVEDARVRLAAVRLGRDFGTSVEVQSGLRTADAVIVDPPDSLVDGAAVQVRSRQAEK